MTQPDQGKALGPLVVSAVNPRYFSIAGDDRHVVYLTGAHVNNNLQDGLGQGADCAAEAERFDYPAYLAFLKERGHNFIRLWRWEQFKGLLPAANVHFCMTPQPWPRTGPGMAKDRKPKFDLAQFDPAFFDRLRERVAAAADQGIYVSVMLFEGFSLHVTAAPDNVEGHPFHAANNVNGIGIGSVDDYQVLPLDPRVQEIQEAYIRQVVDTVQDLPNVLYEVANESPGGGSVDRQFAEQMRLDTSEWGDSTQWQYWVIEFLREYEAQRGYQRHPIGMTMQFPVPDVARVNKPLFDGPADWVSPGSGEPPSEDHPPALDWLGNPPANDGRKVVLTDNDHYSPFKADALWAWKSFMRGHNPILYDLAIVGGFNPADQSFAGLEPARRSIGDTLRYAQKVGLADLQPCGELSSTGYALAHPGHEYVVLQATDSAEPFTVELVEGTYACEWFGVNSRTASQATPTTVAQPGRVTFTVLLEDRQAVLYLKRQD